MKLSSKVKTRSEDYMKTVFGGSQSLIRKRSKNNKSIQETYRDRGQYQHEELGDVLESGV